MAWRYRNISIRYMYLQKYLVYYRYNHLLEPALELPELGVPGLVRPCSLMEAFLMYSWVS